MRVMRVLVITLSAILTFVIRVAAQPDNFSSINFNKADSVARVYQGHSLDNLKTLADKLTAPLSTDVEKFRAIYTWTCLNIENNYELFQESKEKRKKYQNNPEALREWNQQFVARLYKELRKSKTTLCTGYAYLVRELAMHAGINSTIVNGYGRSTQSNIGGQGFANHSWNIVELNGKRYFCDPTWSAGATDAATKLFVKNYNDIYFLLEPEQFVRNHYPLDTAQMLLQEKPTLDEFLNRPLIYYPIFNYRIDNISLETFEIDATREKPVTFRFTGSNKKVEKVELRTKRSGVEQSYFPDVTQTDCDLSFEHLFTSKGTYTVHIVFDGTVVVTYSVVVVG